MSEKQEEKDQPEKQREAPPRRIDPKLSDTFLHNLTSTREYRRYSTIKLREQEQEQPEKPVPPRQDDPLLGDYAEKGDKPTKKTRQKQE